jgi:hypothetical protein
MTLQLVQNRNRLYKLIHSKEIKVFPLLDTHGNTLERNFGCNTKHPPFTVATQINGLLRATQNNIQRFFPIASKT